MTNRTKLVNGLTNYLRKLSTRRNSGVVTADDAQRYLSNRNYRGNRNSRLSVIRTALNDTKFASVGYTPSTRPVARSRRIAVWVA